MTLIIAALLVAVVLALLSGWDFTSQPLSAAFDHISNYFLNPQFTVTLDFTKRYIIAVIVVIAVVGWLVEHLSNWWKNRKLPSWLRDL